MDDDGDNDDGAAGKELVVVGFARNCVGMVCTVDPALFPLRPAEVVE